MSPASADGLFTTEPSGKPGLRLLNMYRGDANDSTCLIILLLGPHTQKAYGTSSVFIFLLKIGNGALKSMQEL